MVANDERGVSKRTPGNITSDRGYAWLLFLKGISVTEITRQINQRAQEEGRNYSIGRIQVHNDIQKELARYKRENEALISDQLSLELGKINLLEFEYWNAWERSKSPKRKTEYTPVDQAELLPKPESTCKAEAAAAVPVRLRRTKTTIEVGNGDPRYLEGVQWCIEKRARLLGLEKPEAAAGNMTLYQYVMELSQKEAKEAQALEENTQT